MGKRHNGYDAFISYSHQRDVPLAKALEEGLERLARHPYTHHRRMNVFRDTTSLAASSDLGGAIKEALATCRYFIYLASPEAAASRWVREEIAYWRSNHSMDRFIIALSAGHIVWDESAGDFDWDRTTALPNQLRGAFAHQPLWVDFRPFRDAPADVRSMASETDFRDAVVTVAAPLHGLSKDQLDGKDLHHERTWRWVRRSLISTAAVAVTGFMVAGGVAWQKSDEADARARSSASRALAARALEVAASDPRKAAQFALYAHAVEATGEATQALGQAVAANDNATQHLQAGYGEVAAFRGIGHVTATNVAVSRDGSVMAYYADLDPDAMDGGERVVHLYDIQERRALPSLRGKSWPQDGGGLMFSWDGRSLAVETPDNQVEVWDVAHRKLLRTITASHGGDLAGAFKRLRAFAFSGDGKRLAAAFYSPAPDGEEYPFSLAVWDTATGRLISKEKATPDAISLASDGKQRLRVLDSLAGTTRILEPDAKDWSSPQRIMGLPPTDSRAVTLSDDGARAYLDRGPDEKDELWDLAEGKRLSTYDSDVRDAPVMPANASNRLLEAADQAVVAYDTAAGRQRTLGSFSFPVNALAASGDGMWVAAGSSDGAVSLLSTSSFQAGTTLPNLQQVKATELTADKRLAFRSGSAGTGLWRVTEKGIQRIGHIDLHMVNKPTRRDDLIASADGTSALVTQEGTASLWNPRSGTRLNPPRQFGSDFRPLAFLPDNQHVLALKDNALQVLDPRSWQVQDTVPVESGSTAVTAVSTDRRTVAVLESGELSVWRYRDGQGLKRVRTASVEGAVTFDKSLAVSPHGEKVSIVNEDKRLFVVDVASGRIARSTTAPAAAEMAAVFSSDSALLVQAFGTGDDAGLQFWDTATGEARGTWSYKGLSSRAASAPNVLTGPDGSTLAFRPDGSLVRHAVSITAWHEVLCRLAPGELPDAEYDRYLKGMDVAAPCRTPAE